MSEPVRISAKTLGALAMPNYCPRCFWIERRMKGKLPFRIFPGIFSSLDSYGKRTVAGWFDRHGSAPPWLAGLGEIARLIPPPHHNTFYVTDAGTSIQLTGDPDGVFAMADGSRAIVDYKTAKFTGHQDELFPMYEAQLNAYAAIGERRGLKPVSKLALVYTEPVTDEASTASDLNTTEEGFLLGFRARILPVEIKPALVHDLLRLARDILDSPTPPARKLGCKDCDLLDALLRVAAI